jgi:hypothetical protein
MNLVVGHELRANSGGWPASCHVTATHVTRVASAACGRVLRLHVELVLCLVGA